jgi:L-serine/L-threonine ammonia-lyase
MMWLRKHDLEDSLQFATDMRVVTEPACGAALSLCYVNAGYLDEFEHVIIVVCGGAGITYDGLLGLSDQTIG